MATIATAGHVDHGKSSLVRALTGTDPDRLAEEKRRGMTIELGFAHMVAPDGTVLSFVDVPGHADFVRTMIAGASGVNVALLVIDAVEGWKPQTAEHLAVCELLDIPVGVVALTKSDLVDADRIDDLTSTTRRELDGSSIEWLGIVATSVVTSIGHLELVELLGSAATRAARDTNRSDRPRLFIDRVFSIVGSGTVVTGTLDSGSLRAGDELVSVPGGHRGAVRAIHTHGREVEAGRPGTRCAVNLARTSTRDLDRGEALVIEGHWKLTGVADVRWRSARGAQMLPTNGRGWTMHVGTARREVSLRLVHSADDIVRVRFDPPLPLAPGDRLILRHTGTDTTVAGGTVLDVDPRLRTTRARPDGSVDSILSGHGWVRTDEARRLTGTGQTPIAGDWVAAGAVVRDTTARLTRLLDDGPVDLVGLSEPERALIGTLPGVVVERGVARTTQDDPLFDDPCVEIIRSAGPTPPASATFDRDAIRRLVGAGVLFEHDGIAFHIDVLRSMAPVLDRLWAQHPEGFTVSHLRETLGITRKHAVPLAECLDKARITRRTGDLRLPMP